ncbi:MAG: c-type cytochrome [Anaerolineales bacterium]|nr:MAG: c-type cytochrome [Anaerolineales bacterium]
MKWHIALGTIALIVLVALLTLTAVNESARMEKFSQAFESRQVEAGASLFQNNCRTCHGPQGEGIPGVAPSINAVDLFNGERLAAIGFSGTLSDYLKGVIASGRPVPSAGTSYPQRMPTWGQEFGGPLRQDQIEGLVGFILNWEDRALAADAGGAVSVSENVPVGVDISISLPEGDPKAGATLAQSSRVGCSACHELASVGPAWAPAAGQPGIGERAAQRLTQADYAGNADTPEQYLLESIVNANAYVVAGYAEGLMPGDFANRLSGQEAADLIAYMLTLR